MIDLFHIILEYLYKKPLDGSFYDLRECITEKKLNTKDGKRSSFEKFQKVVDFLVSKDYIKFEQRPAKDESTGSLFNVQIKYGEDPTELGSKEANFDTTYPMAMMTLAGSNYIFERKRIYISTFIVALSSVVITLLNFIYSSNSNKAVIEKEIIVKDSLINQKENEIKLLKEKTILMKSTIDSLSKGILKSTNQ